MRSVLCVPMSVIVGLLLLMAGCGVEKKDNVELRASPAVSVRVTQVVQPTERELLRFPGVVYPKRHANLTFQVSGVLQNHSLELGQTVESEQPMAQLYNPELGPARDARKARLMELQVQLKQAERDQQRTERLYEGGTVSRQARERQSSEVNALKAAVGSAEAALHQSESLLSETKMSAPFKGTIDALLVEPGEFVASGQPVVRLAARDRYEVEIRVPGHLLDNVEVDQSVPVWNALNGKKWLGKVTELGRSNSPGDVLYPLIVTLDTPDARPGDAVEVGLEKKNSDHLSVPITAVMRSPSGTTVFRIDDGRAYRESIVVAGLRGERALIESGALREGDWVVSAGIGRLANGDSVELLR